MDFEFCLIYPIIENANQRFCVTVAYYILLVEKGVYYSV